MSAKLMSGLIETPLRREEFRRSLASVAQTAASVDKALPLK